MGESIESEIASHEFEVSGIWPIRRRLRRAHDISGLNSWAHCDASETLGKRWPGQAIRAGDSTRNCASRMSSSRLRPSPWREPSSMAIATTM